MRYLASLLSILLTLSSLTAAEHWKVSPDQASPTDNVLRVREGKTIVERVWDGINFNVEWIPEGVPVGPYGHVVRQPYDADKISIAATIVSDSATLHCAPDEEYLVNLPIILQNQKLMGHGATIKRGPLVKATTTKASPAGSKELTVDDTSGFQLFHRVFAVLTPGVLGGHAMAKTFGTGYLIIGIDGNKLTLSKPLVKTVPAGKPVVVHDNMLFQLSYETIGRIEDVTFDGGNDVHDYVCDWTTYAVNVHYCEIRNCRFRNIPNECISMTAGAVVNCRGENLWGSFVHTRTPTPHVPYGLLIQNCHLAGVTLKDNGHDEGAITFSASSRNIRVRDCVFDNSTHARGRGVFGNLSAMDDADRDGSFVVSNVKASNFGQVLTVSTNGAKYNFDRAVIFNSRFSDCQTLSFGGHAPITKPHIEAVTVSNCEFTNTTVTLGKTQDAKWLNNTLRYTKDFDGKATAALMVWDCGSVEIAGGSVTSDTDGRIANGVWLYCETANPSELTTANMRAKVNGIDITGFAGGLVVNNSAQWATTPSHDVDGWTFGGVKVWPLEATNVIGIEVPAGAVASGCYVNLPDAANGIATCGIILKGPRDPSKIGGIAMHCVVPNASGGAQALRIGTYAGGGNNCMALGNVLAKAVACKGEDNTDKGNTVIK